MVRFQDQTDLSQEPAKMMLLSLPPMARQVTGTLGPWYFPTVVRVWSGGQSRPWGGDGETKALTHLEVVPGDSAAGLGGEDGLWLCWVGQDGEDL